MNARMNVCALAATAVLGLVSGAEAQMNRGIRLMTAPPARNAGLQDATGRADVNVRRGTVDLTV